LFRAIIVTPPAFRSPIPIGFDTMQHPGLCLLTTRQNASRNASAQNHEA
jgi:hypothetical protein